jgi:hypothetical protein
VLVFLCPLCVRHGKEVYSASKGIQDSLVNVFPVLFVINAIAVDELGSARETEVSASIGPPFVFKTSLQEAALGAAKNSLDSVLRETICRLDACK